MKKKILIIAVLVALLSAPVFSIGIGAAFSAGFVSLPSQAMLSLKLDEYPSDSKKWEKESDDGGLISGFEVVIFVLSLAIVGGFRRRK